MSESNRCESCAFPAKSLALLHNVCCDCRADESFSREYECLGFHDDVSGGGVRSVRAFPPRMLCKVALKKVSTSHKIVASAVSAFVAIASVCECWLTEFCVMESIDCLQSECAEVSHVQAEVSHVGHGKVIPIELVPPWLIFSLSEATSSLAEVLFDCSFGTILASAADCISSFSKTTGADDLPCRQCRLSEASRIFLAL